MNESLSINISVEKVTKNSGCVGRHNNYDTNFIAYSLQILRKNYNESIAKDKKFVREERN